MPVYDIGGVPVDFPFEPYQVQRDYMSKLLQCLQQSTNGLLESPTGTGKTLSILCASLAWLVHSRSHEAARFPIKLELPEHSHLGAAFEHNATKAGRTKIIYASRTHSQLSQAMQELKKSSYNYVRAIVLGSRIQLCIHPDVPKSENNATVTYLCKEKVATRSCVYYRRVEQMKDSSELANVPILDIEDLVTVGSRTKACPFYLSKEMVERADIIFMPYNYLLDAKARKANNLELQNSVIILDEAHNVERMCEDSGSAVLSSTDIALAIEDVSHVMETMGESASVPGLAETENEKKEFSLHELSLLKQQLLDLEKSVDDIAFPASQREVNFSGSYIFGLLAKASVHFHNVSGVVSLFGAITGYLTTLSERNSFKRRGSGLQAVSDFLEIVYAGQGEEYIAAVRRCFKVYVVAEEPKQTKRNFKRADGWTATNQPAAHAPLKSSAKIVHFWCFNPGFGMRQLASRGVRSIVLTSGTLAPLTPLINELNISIPVTLENPHIIDRSQVLVRVIAKGSDGQLLSSVYNNRNNPDYIRSLGRTLLSVCPVIPNGLLVFFPSYTVLDKCVEGWQSGGLWSEINNRKAIFVEPRTKDAFNTTMDEFYQRIQDTQAKGAIFLAVCRGKVSEGLDFADINGRAVLITGLPFPPLHDPRVVLKKEYLTSNRTPENRLITGDEWYALQASRAVNQAIGRVIRHRNDYGAILLCDARFQNAHQQMQLSSWVRSHLVHDPNQRFGTVIKDLANFFRIAKNTAMPAAQREFQEKDTGIGDKVNDSKLCSTSTNQLQLPRDAKGTVSDGKRLPLQPSLSQLPFSIDEYLTAPPNALLSKSEATSGMLGKLESATNSVNISNPLDYCDQRLPKDNQTLKRGPQSLCSSTVIDDGGNNEGRKFKKPKLVMVPSGSIKYETENEQLPCSSSSSSTIAEPASTEGSIDLGDSSDSLKLMKAIKRSINPTLYKLFLRTIGQYCADHDFERFYSNILQCIGAPEHRHIVKDLRKFVLAKHKEQFDEELKKLT
ncbi:regulator of telomere elongation helicase 1 homolog isoform X2 [Anopheles darlingi]|uniref:regulator of telomere elongation helicase 1 homolog isoform X2 n=1 Tax=Anopheles darlingi TaxID=43151 RepID=UPI0021001078|nr:regulator of telomere elongation helicase 1 homolog isoform X2 [Anopheles darlingi]